MKSIIALLILFVTTVGLEAQDAPKKAMFGKENLNGGERLLVSFSVHSKVLVLKGNLDKGLLSKMPLPLFPSEAINMGLLGETVVSFTVKEDGSVEGIHTDNSTHKEFEQESIAALKQWKFSHPVYRGKPTQLVLQATFIFSMFEEKD